MRTNDYRYHEIKQQLIKEIVQLNVHDRLPSRTKLAERYNAARTTIERAISELIGEGYVYSRDGSGTYVSETGRLRGNYISKIKSWGLVLPNIMDDTYPGILRGVEDVANAHDINVVICNTDHNAEKQSKYLYKLMESGISGLIIVPVIQGTDARPIRKLQELGIPVVSCNRRLEDPDVPSVLSNNFYGAYLATKHLIEIGRTRIGFISLPAYSVSMERYQGYSSALAEAGFCLNEDCVVFESSFDEDRHGYAAAKKIMEKNEEIDAIFCFNDTVARGCFEALEELNLRIGRDVSLVGYDDTAICESLPVKLTSVRFKPYEIGRASAELLIELTEKERPLESRILLFQPELVVRESTSPTPMV